MLLLSLVVEDVVPFSIVCRAGHRGASIPFFPQEYSVTSGAQRQAHSETQKLGAPLVSFFAEELGDVHRFGWGRSEINGQLLWRGEVSLTH